MWNRIGAIILIGFAAVGPLQAQNGVTVQGRVVDGSTGAALAGAVIDLLGTGNAVTNDAGAFRFTDVRPGRQTLEVEMLGYVARRVDMAVRADTSLVVSLDPAPIRLDTLTVRPRTITVRGRVVDAETGMWLFDADVVADNGRTTRTNPAGGFKLSGVPAGMRVDVSARALGYLQGHAEFEAVEDTTLSFALEKDEVAQRMIAEQVGKLETRANAFPRSKKVISRDELLRSLNWTTGDLLRQRLGRDTMYIGCVVIDDRLRPASLDELQTYLPDEIERIEIIDRATMLRIYTRNFIRRMMGNQVTLPPIFMNAGFGGIRCR